MKAALLVLAVAAPAAADPSIDGAAAGAAPAASIASAGDRAPSGPAIGVELGDPTSATIAMFAGKLSVGAAVGTGTLAGPGFSTHLDLQLVVAELAPHVPLRVGFGGRFYHHGYSPASIDEIPDNHVGVRASANVALERPKYQLYAELAPGVDLHRSRSCTFASGVDAICPHAQERPLFVQLAVGMRWFLGRK